MHQEPTEKVKRELERCIKIGKAIEARGEYFWDAYIRFEEKLTTEKFCWINR